MTANLLLSLLLSSMLLSCSSGYNRTEATRSAQVPHQIIAIEPSPGSTDLQLGQAALSLGDYARAIELFSQVYNEDGSNWEALYYLGLVHTAQGAYSESRNFFERALNRVGESKKSRSRLYCAVARSWEREGRVGAARLNYYTANNLDPESIEATAALLRLSSGQSD